MTGQQIIDSRRAPRAVGHYPHARRHGGLLILSGIGPRRPEDGSVPGNRLDDEGRLVAVDFAAQYRQLLANVTAVLAEAGLTLADLIDVTVYLTDMGRDFALHNALWAESFPDPLAAPCRTTLGVVALPTPIAVEWKCLAALRDER